MPKVVVSKRDSKSSHNPLFFLSTQQEVSLKTKIIEIKLETKKQIINFLVVFPLLKLMND